jgi:hypothetical protein
MLYRVVLQGPRAGDGNVAQVQREFMRVTGLPENVTEQLFRTMPQILKRNLTEADAQRIAQTLRAIGTVATVEREQEAPREAGINPATISPLAPQPYALALPPAETPDIAAPPSKRPKYLLFLIGAALLLALGIVAAPTVDDWVASLRPATGRAPTAPAPKRSQANAPAEPRVFRPDLASGPWRCTDQRTGVSTYWNYRDDGTLLYLGNDVAHGETAIPGPDNPVSWSITSERLAWRYADKPPRSFTLLELAFDRFDYTSPSTGAIYCRRP